MFIPKRTLIILGGVLLCLSFASGVIVLQNTGKRKVQSIRMKVPFRQEVTVAPSPVPSVIPTIDPTIQWQTYRNNSFSMKYPNRFTISEVDLPYTVLYPKTYSSITFTDSNSTITVTVAKNTGDYSTATIVGNGPYLRYASSLITSDARQIKFIAGEEAPTVSRIPAGKNGTAIDTLIIHNNKVYQLTLSPIDADPSTYNAMLSTLTLLDQEPDDVTDSWQVYINSTYGYTVKYPYSYGLDHGVAASGSALTQIFDNSKTSASAKFRIEVQDIKNIGQSDITSRNMIGLPLDQYINKKWDYNKASSSAVPNKTVSAIKEITVGGKLAYQFSVTGEYRDDRGSERVSEEYVYIFTESGGYKYKIWYPKTNQIYSEMLKTILFTK